MIVGIDATTAVNGSLSGVGYHILRLLEALDVQAPSGTEFRIFFQAFDARTRQHAHELLPHSSRMRLVPVPFIRTGLHTLHQAFDRIIMPAAVARHRCDVFHGPSHVLPAVRTPSVVTIHDLAFFKHDLYEASFATALRRHVAASIANATAVIALSESTRRDVLHITGRCDGVHVIHGAGNYPTPHETKPAQDDWRTLAQRGIAGRYVLYVGDFNARKNIPYLLESFGRFKRDRAFSDVQLVLAGNSRDARAALERQASSLGLSVSDVVFAGRVDDAELRILYRNAAVFALCSLMEGFTLVTLEAMSYGIPVLATDTSSIAEGTGDAAELVPLDNPDAVAEGLRTAITPGLRRDEMRRRGFERVARFSWERAARYTLEMYRAISLAHRTPHSLRQHLA